MKQTFKCCTCKNTFDEFAIQLVLWREGVEVCPFCSTSEKEGKFKVMKQTF